MGKKYNEFYKNGGLLGYEGVQVNTKPVSKIDAVFSNSDTHLTVTVEYGDKEVNPDTERLELDVGDISDGIRVTNIAHYWNNELIQGDDDNE